MSGCDSAGTAAEVHKTETPLGQNEHRADGNLTDERRRDSPYLHVYASDNHHADIPKLRLGSTNNPRSTCFPLGNSFVK
jgi:hypothetical protein